MYKTKQKLILNSKCTTVMSTTIYGTEKFRTYLQVLQGQT